MSKLAVIDLGTNVINVLVGAVDQEKYTVLYEEKITKAMVQQPLYAMHISLEEQKNIVDTLVSIKRKLDINGIRFIVAKATSLLRDAPNAVEIIEAIRSATDIEVEIISGIEEATLIYHGISACFTLTDGYGLIIDIGGGSVECIIFDYVKPLWQRSFALGIRRVAAQFSYSDPITPLQVDLLEDYYRTALAPLFVETKRYRPRQLIGSSGAFRTLMMLYTCHYNFSATKANSSIKRISAEQFFELYQVILTTPVYVWQKKLSIESVFLKLLPLSAILIKVILKTCNLEEIIISDSSLRTGLFIREWNRLKQEELI
ncbi:Ppx/GppA phosphatase family protein [Cardinium endosymbiont of Oedothorax gibbosus]|uniref:Ppx/GppA phosphatase family protein n=1 Tax=Cardinium endosymbiont of Oedothorax gibbosus TaxID=931101 RepID=UPI0020253DCD|nr:hypothetical protein [Cardinium endosymbiont of Oedothorax gibbosus]CAH2560154.1 Exopolyphosphatase family protein [Cardinium endosymbiont of Oedothorax gibbosus]